MNLKKKNLKIATILPYKENYSKDKASAASLWVSEFFRKSKFKKTNFIYGNTRYKNYLTKNYKNIYLKSLNSKFVSSTNEYCKKLVKEINVNKFDIVEIHNRPLIFFKIYKDINSRIIFYFHNDPLSMKGSRSIKERLDILKKIDKIIFVSEWTKNRFFTDLDEKLNTKTEVIYPSVKKLKKKNKNKFITFVGKLNYSKGYDLFEKSINKILNEFPKWKAFSIGDEDRREIYVNHKNHFELGFLSHKKTINFLSKSDIVVVPSRWNEPFGRTALEASSVGCATIITDRGGLIETTDHAIILKKIDSHSLYTQIKKLIKNPKIKLNIQKLSRNNVKHLIEKNTILIDEMRESCLPNFKINYLKKKLKIINLYNQGQKLNHRLFNISLGKKFTNGFVRNNHDVLEISDRDFLKKNKSFNIFSNRKNFQKYLIQTFKNYNPDMLFFGHTNNIDLTTLDEFKTFNKNLIISQWNEDPIMESLNYSKKNLENIKLYSKFVDHNFITTDPSILKKYNLHNFHFLFIPVDKNIECYDVYNMRPKMELFYAMSHGVNRAILKDGIEDDRIIFLDKLVKKIPSIKYDFYGFANKQPIWGNDFNNALINSKMALNLSRGKPTKYYTSNRIASIMGNGLLTFVDKKVSLSDFFSKKEIIFYENISDLSKKIKFYASNDKERIKIAKNGKIKYFKLFNEKRVAKYLTDISLGNESSLI